MGLYFVILVFIFGMAIGSFLNCLAWRLYTEETVWGRSHCPKCGVKISWYDNIPILSYVLLNAKCRHCAEKISPIYFWMEVLSGLLFAFVFMLNFQFDFNVLRGIILAMNFNWHWFGILLRDFTLLSTLIFIFLTDFRWFVIFDGASLFGAAAMLMFNLSLGLLSWQSMAIGMALGAGIFVLQSVFSGGGWVGGGDVRMGLLMGAALGWPNTAVALGLAYLIGAVWGVGLIIAGKKKLDWRRLFKRGEPTDKEIAEAALPFGTFLGLGTFIAFYWGSAIINWYFSYLF